MTEFNDWNKFENVKSRMAQYAWDSGMNIAFVDAIRYSENFKDLKCCLKEAVGVGSEKFKEQFDYVLELED